MPLQATSGAASYDAFGGGVPAVPNYIEDVFSTYLYAGNGSTQTITNGIDLAGKGGLVWQKSRTSGFAYTSHILHSPNVTSGTNQLLLDSATTAGAGVTLGAYTYLSTGFSINGGFNDFGNASGQNYASWTFRKQPKFFDVVTYTGNGTTQNIAHNLGSVPGCIIVKEASAAGNDWQVYHRSTTNTCGRLFLNLTNAENANGRANTWGDNTNPVPPTSTVFTVGNTGSVNNNGATFVAYLFAHDAGGFGLTGTDNVISCGSFTGDGSGAATVNLGYEPQWVMIKRTDAASDWEMLDNMRGLFNYSPYTGSGKAANRLLANTSGAEQANYVGCGISATGFAYGNGYAGSTYIYIAIRRGPMKVPTSGTSVYNADTTITATTPAAVSGFVTDLMISTNRTNKATYNEMFWSNRLTANGYTSSTNTTAEQAGGAFGAWDTMNGSGTSALQSAGVSDMAWMFRRAPSFFDEVCYTGTGSALTVSHNLGAVPEIIIIKRRSSAASNNNWYTGWNMSGPTYMESLLNTSDAGTLYTYPNWFTSTPTTTTFAIAGGGNVNANTATYVAYLFATCAGVSKVGSYTGTGTTKQIDCGFTGGARFVLIKRTDSTGDWYVWDSARGIVAGNDPYLLLNSTAAEVTNTDYVDTYSAGFEISSTAPAAINASGGSFIFFAVA